MNQVPARTSYRSDSRIWLLVWAWMATVVGVFSALAALFLLLREHKIDAGRAPATERAVAAKDFSQSNSVSIALGEHESGDGLRLLGTERDGQTVVVVVNGVACRRADIESIQQARPTTTPGMRCFFYFALDPAFKERDVRSVRIEIEYSSPMPGQLGLDYDALSSDQAQRNSYKQIPLAGLPGVRDWQLATFHLRDAAFAGSQNGGADFRFWTRQTNQFIRRVTVTRE